MSSSVFQDVARRDFIYGDLTTVGTAFLRIMQEMDIKGAELS
jgi:hypothetical protein